MNDLDFKSIVEESIKESIKKIDINQRVEDQINQCIAHVLADNLTTTIKAKVFDYIEKNTDRICAKIIYRALNNKFGNDLDSTLKNRFESILGKVVTEWIEDKFKFEVNLKD